MRHQHEGVIVDHGRPGSRVPHWRWQYSYERTTAQGQRYARGGYEPTLQAAFARLAALQRYEEARR